MNLKNAHLYLSSLVVFRKLLDDPLLKAFGSLSQGMEAPLSAQVDSYASFASLLLAEGGNWSDYLLNKVLGDDNFYVRLHAGGRAIKKPLAQAVENELTMLQKLASISSAQVLSSINCGFAMPGWENSGHDFIACYESFLRNIRQHGYGVFSQYHMFRVTGGRLLPVAHPDRVTMAMLSGYQRERKQVMDNTLALLEDRPAANILLYGDSGTGKSTTVKAIVNQLAGKGLRLIELPKEEIRHLPELIDELSDNPLKFILFIDDLSFSEQNDSFSALKAILEGSVSSRPANMVIYATSNRRHLVRENFAQRQGGDVHLRDTLEEVGSLSERFGMLITFLRPDRDLYLDIVAGYCKDFGLSFSNDMHKQAEAFALERGGRSARIARQFAEFMVSQQQRG